MGHIRLGTLPRTRKWIQVLDLIGGGAGTPEVAAATMEASQRGLAKAASDPGLVHTVWLLGCAYSPQRWAYRPGRDGPDGGGRDSDGPWDPADREPIRDHADRCSAGL